jgi:GH43 family beta-xylosidase
VNKTITEYNDAWIPQRADPYVYRHKDGTYYFTASVPEYDRIVLRKANQLYELNQAQEQVIWTKHESGPMSKHIWAPELHYIFDHWYIYFAAGEAENMWNIRPYVLECLGDDPMKDPWREIGKMQAADEDDFSFRNFSLDSTVFEHRGNYYFVWAEKVGVGKMISNLYIAQLETANKLKSAQVLLTTPDYDWERDGFWVNEGPAIIKRGDKIYLVFSASATGACYCMGMMFANQEDDLLDPRSWDKERYPVLETDEKKGIYGPGHNSFTQDEAGEDILVYHARQYEEIQGDPLYDPNRHAMLMKMKWTKDNYPIFDYKSNISVNPSKS